MSVCVNYSSRMLSGEIPQSPPISARLLDSAPGLEAAPVIRMVRSALQGFRNVHRFPMIFPQILPRLAYSLTVLALNRKTSAASHMVSSGFPLTVGFAVLLPVRTPFQSSAFRALSA
jgi:hypothetical protein